MGLATIALGYFFIRILIHVSIYSAQILISLLLGSRAGVQHRFALRSIEGKISPGWQTQLRWSVVSILIGALTSVVIFILVKQGVAPVYFDIGQRGWLYFSASILVYLFLYDLYFYWTHRLFHGISIFRSFHAKHHEAEVPSVWTMYFFHPVEAFVYSVVHVIIISLLPLHVAAVIIVLVLIDLRNWFFHWGLQFWPKNPIFKNSILTNGSFHFQHHQAAKSNYGFFFRFWDKICGTEEN